jgi:DNA modification methylase
MHRVLKPTGSFVLNIKEKVVNGQRHRYVNHLIDMMVDEQGWMWTEEYLWHKRNSTPGKWPNRFRDAWESCHHFTKQKKFAMYQDAVKVPVGDWSKKRLANLSDTDKTRDDSATQSGFGKNISNWVGRDMVFPDNVLHLATECSNSGHSAAFPYAIPEWFIKLFSAEGDLVLDPFVGSGTTLLAARDLKREYIGVDSYKESYDIAVARMASYSK